MAPSDPAGTSGSLESVAEVGPSQKHQAYVLGAHAIFETYWKGNLHNILEVLKELSERASVVLSWKKQGKLHEFTKASAVTRVWQRVGDQVAHATSEILAGLEPTRSEFFAHDLLPLLLRMREVWWATQRHVAGNFLSLYQKYEDSPQQWLMALREVDVHLLRTAIVHREILEGELEKLARTIELDGELACADNIRHLQDVFVKEGVGYWLAEHLDLIWSEFGNQVQKGVVNLYKAFDSTFVRSWASSSQCRADDVARDIHESWTGFIGRVQESRRYVVEEETSSYTQDELAVDLENSSIPHRIYIYTRILRRYEALVNHDWQVTYRTTIALLDQSLAANGPQQGGHTVPVIHTKVTVIVTKIWEEVMVEIRQTFKECREKFEEAILCDRTL
ncbi:unnamed protein product [Ixodes pacificus]